MCNLQKQLDLMKVFQLSAEVSRLKEEQDGQDHRRFPIEVMGPGEAIERDNRQRREQALKEKEHFRAGAQLINRDEEIENRREMNLQHVVHRVADHYEIGRASCRERV